MAPEYLGDLICQSGEQQCDHYNQQYGPLCLVCLYKYACFLCPRGVPETVRLEVSSHKPFVRRLLKNSKAVIIIFHRIKHLLCNSQIQGLWKWHRRIWAEVHTWASVYIFCPSCSLDVSVSLSANCIHKSHFFSSLLSSPPPLCHGFSTKTFTDAMFVSSRGQVPITSISSP